MVYIYIYIWYIYSIYIYIYMVSFDPSFKRPTCLATLKSCNTTKQPVCV